jgi:hypothetical protein
VPVAVAAALAAVGSVVLVRRRSAA